MPDELNHGTMVASLIAGSRSDLNISGVAPDAGLAIARIVKLDACNAATIAQNLIAAFTWFRSIGDVQIVNVSANIPPNQALIESLRALQQTGTLVVAATGDVAESREGRPSPRRSRTCSGVGALGSSTKKVWPKSTRGPQVDLVAPGIGSGVIVSSLVSPAAQFGDDAGRNLVREPARRRCRSARLGQAPGVGREPRLCGVDLVGEAPLRSAPEPRRRATDCSTSRRRSRRRPRRTSTSRTTGRPRRGVSPRSPHRTQLAARVGGNDDPTRRLSDRDHGLPDCPHHRQGAADGLPAARCVAVGDRQGHGGFAASSCLVHEGRDVDSRLRVPRLGSWYVVVTAPKSLTPVGYTLRVG